MLATWVHFCLGPNTDSVHINLCAKTLTRITFGPVANSDVVLWLQEGCSNEFLRPGKAFTHGYSPLGSFNTLWF